MNMLGLSLDITDLIVLASSSGGTPSSPADVTWGDGTKATWGDGTQVDWSAES